MMLLTILVLFLINNNAYAIGTKTDDGYLLTEQEIIDIANKLNNFENKIDKLNKKIFDLENVIGKQDELILGLEKEIKLKDEIILAVREENKRLNIVLDKHIELSDIALAKADETIELQNKQIFALEELNKEYEMQSSLSILDKLKLIGAGVAVYSVLDMVTN